MTDFGSLGYLPLRKTLIPWEEEERNKILTKNTIILPFFPHPIDALMGTTREYITHTENHLSYILNPLMMEGEV